MTPILAFDIETVPDVAGLRRLHGIDAKLSDRDVADFAFRERRAHTGQDFLPLHLHRVVAIACALREGESFRCWALGSADDDEGELIRRFFDGIEKYTPQLVSWNGGGFDLPVLHYRSLVHGVSAARYWDTGDDDREFRFNNYISRYHSRHLDLMDLLSLYQGRASAPLDQLARLLGFPGKLGMDGSRTYATTARPMPPIRTSCSCASSACGVFSTKHITGARWSLPAPRSPSPQIPTGASLSRGGAEHSVAHAGCPH